MVDTLTTLSLTTQTHYDRDLMYNAKQAQVFYQAGQKKNLAKNSGKVISFRRFNTLTPSTTALVEGVTPVATAISQTEVTASVAHYGAFVEVSDQLDMLAVDPVIAEMTPILGQHGGESVESIIQDVIEAGTSVMYATGSARSSQAATNILTVALIRKAVRTLDSNNTRRFKGPEENSMVGAGEYLLFVTEDQVYDLKGDSEWKTHQQNTSEGAKKLYNGEVGMIDGCRIIQSTLCPVFAAAGSGGVDVHGALLVGQHAFGVVDVAGTGKFKTIAKPLGSGGTSDPLDQRATVGWKSTFVSKILNNNFMTRIETGVTG